MVYKCCRIVYEIVGTDSQFSFSVADLFHSTELPIFRKATILIIFYFIVHLIVDIRARCPFNRVSNINRFPWSYN